MSKRKKHDELPTRQVRKSITTVLHKIEECIRINKTPGGSSVPAITKALLSEFNYNNATAVKKALKDGVDKGLLTKNKASYLVTGDPMYVDTSEKVDIEDIKIGKGKLANDSSAKLLCMELFLPCFTLNRCSYLSIVVV